MDKSAWIGKSRKVKKPWGFERQWGAMQTIQGKQLFINAGCRTSLKYHTSKDEVLFLVSGTASIEYADEEWHRYVDVDIKESKMHPGQYLAVQSYCAYRITAETDCVFLEISNSLRGTTVRLEDDYGRKTKPNNGK